MMLGERNINVLPWESSFGEALIRQEDIDQEQASLHVGTFFDCQLSSIPRTVNLPPGKLGLIVQLLPLLYSSSDVMTDLQQVSRLSSSEHDEQELAMARLQEAAQARDEHAFLKALERVEWQNRPAADFVRAAKLALKAGAYAAAHQVSAEGTKRYPDNPEIQKYARVLAPPKVMPSDRVLHSGHKANREWLKAHGSEYSGQWVAVRNGKLLGAAGSVRELVEQVGDTKDALLTRAF